jgi:Zn-dependent protease
MAVLKAKADCIIFNASGIKIIPSRGKPTSYKADVLILLSGGVFNIFLGVLLKLLGFEQVAVANFAIGAFNLLPLSFLDGGAIVLAIAENFEANTAKLDTFLRCVTGLLLATIILVATFNNVFNISLLILAVYLLAVNVFEAFQRKLAFSSKEEVGVRGGAP